MTRDEFRKIAYELVQAYEGVTRWNENLRADLSDLLETNGELKGMIERLAKHRDEWREYGYRMASLRDMLRDGYGPPADKLEWEE